jgi:hypothetical protein
MATEILKDRNPPKINDELTLTAGEKVHEVGHWRRCAPR